MPLSLAHHGVETRQSEQSEDIETFFRRQENRVRATMEWSVRRFSDRMARLREDGERFEMEYRVK